MENCGLFHVLFRLLRGLAGHAHENGRTKYPCEFGTLAVGQPAGRAARLTGNATAGMLGVVTLTLELSELRSANMKALAQLSRSNENQFDSELTDIENFLLSLYRF